MHVGELEADPVDALRAGVLTLLGVCHVFRCVGGACFFLSCYSRPPTHTHTHTSPHVTPLPHTYYPHTYYPNTHTHTPSNKLSLAEENMREALRQLESLGLETEVCVYTICVLYTICMYTMCMCVWCIESLGLEIEVRVCICMCMYVCVGMGIWKF